MTFIFPIILTFISNLDYHRLPILVGGLEHEFYDFPIILGNVIIPTDEPHHFSEGLVNHQPDFQWGDEWGATVSG